MGDSLLFRVGLFVFATVAACPGLAPGAEAELTEDTVCQLQSSFEQDGFTTAIYNSLSNNDITDLAISRDILKQHNEIFSHKIETKSVTDQQQSGRCWMFAGLNIMRPKVIEKYKLGKFEFSESFLAFWDKLEKANCFLERTIDFRQRDVMDRELELLLRKPVPDGGYWESFVNLVSKYGLVPKEVMPETHSSAHTGSMNKLLSRKLRSDAAVLRQMHTGGKSLEQLRHAKQQMLAGVYKMLVLNYGTPPERFEWRYEDANSVVSEPNSYTPESFYKDFVGVDLSEYVDVFNDPSKQMGKHFRLRLSRNICEGDDVHFANVSVDVLKEAAKKSLLDDEPVWFACDVGKDQNREHGIMAAGLYDYEAIYQIDMPMDKAERALLRESVPNHAMVLQGVDIADDRPVKWLVENSWGKDKGSEGYWTLYDEWFDQYVYSVIVKKQYLPDDVLKIFEEPAEPLPPWDPMWSFVQ